MHFFEPKNAAHAVTAAAFSINFKKSLSPEAMEQCAKNVDPQIKAFLPGTSVVNIPPAVQGLLSTPAIVVYQRMKPDGTPAWLLTAQQNFITAQCAEYTRWADVWKRVSGWLENFFALIDGVKTPVASISLQFIDQFVALASQSASPNLNEEALQSLFSRASKFLPPRFFDNGELWHLHQGWYHVSTNTISGKQLNVVNLGTQMIEEKLTVNIDHLIRHELDDEALALFDGNVGSRPIDVVMNDLHEKNKSFLRDLLSSEAADRIKLND